MDTRTAKADERGHGPDDPPSPWFRDPVVWLGVVAGAAATAWALFAGPYLPYIDWSNHLALIAALTRPYESGAADYMTFSWRPTPYLLFYGLASALTHVVSADVAAKLLLVVSGGASTAGAAALADAYGRSPRLALIAPLGLFGISMGFGFGSFVFATPLLFFALAAHERLLAADPSELRARFFTLMTLLALAYLSHALIFLTACGLLGLRAIVVALFRIHRGPRAMAVPIVRTVLAGIPPSLLALPATIDHIRNPWNEAGSVTDAAARKLAYFVPFAEHRRQIWGHLLERGSYTHVTVMKLSLILLAIWTVLSLWRSHPRKPPPGFGLEVHATALLLLFLVGPNSIEWPSSLWMIYPRYGVIAATVLFLVPRCDLRGWVRAPIAALALGLVVWNADINAGHVSRFSTWAKLYDPVRETIPRRARVLALTVPNRGDNLVRHPAMGSLYFYHMVDGASYVAFLFDAAALPVRQRKDTKPRAPFWKTPHAFDPGTHGKDFDYLVLRGDGMVSRAKQAGLHDRVGDFNGWTVFKTKSPTPRPVE